MILNPFALLSIFIGLISLLLIVVGAVSARCFHLQLKRAENGDEKAVVGNRFHLSLLLVFTALGLRLVAWPLFYILLQSLIPLVPGAMCIFGVTRVMPVFVGFLELMKPLAFFLIGGWLILYGYSQHLNSRPLTDRIIRLLYPVSIIAIIDGAAELMYIVLFSPPGVAVSCCTAIADIAIPPAPILPTPFLSVEYTHIIVASYHVLNLVLCGFIVLLLWKSVKREGILNRPLLALVALIAAINGIIAYGAFKEYLGPNIMDLPDHHCLYCLLQYQPISIVILGLLILGSFLAIWPFFISLFVDPKDSENQFLSFARKLLKWALLCLLVSWAITTLIS